MTVRSNIRTAPWMQDTLREGFVHLAAGRIDEASACCKRLLGAKPDLVEGHFLVGLIALELKQTWTAVNAFGSVTELQKDHGAAWANLAKLFMLAGQPARADAALEKAVQHDDGNPIVLDLIGAVYGLLGDQREAGVWIGRALKKQPNSVMFLERRLGKPLHRQLDFGHGVLRGRAFLRVREKHVKRILEWQ